MCVHVYMYVCVHVCAWLCTHVCAHVLIPSSPRSAGASASKRLELEDLHSKIVALERAQFEAAQRAETQEKQAAEAAAAKSAEEKESKRVEEEKQAHMAAARAARDAARVKAANGDMEEARAARAKAAGEYMLSGVEALAAAKLGALDLELSAAQAAQQEVSPRSAPCTVHPEPQNPKT